MQLMTGGTPSGLCGRDWGFLLDPLLPASCSGRYGVGFLIHV